MYDNKEESNPHFQAINSRTTDTSSKRFHLPWFCNKMVKKNTEKSETSSVNFSEDENENVFASYSVNIRLRLHSLDNRPISGQFY